MPFGMTSACTPHCDSSNFMYLLTAVTAAARVSVGQWILSKPYVLLAFHIKVSAPRRPRSRAVAVDRDRDVGGLPLFADDEHALAARVRRRDQPVDDPRR